MNQINGLCAADKVVVGNSAFLAMSMLSPEDRTHILETLGALATTPLDKWPSDTVHLRRAEKSLYMLDANDQLRAFFRRENDGTLTIVDLAYQATLDLYWPTPVAKE